MTIVRFDTETRSATPIQCGTDRYTADAQCILATWTVDDEPDARIWDRLSGEQMPAELHWALTDPDVIVVAHGAPFDRRIVVRDLKLHSPLTKWRCTQAQAYAHGLPGSLEMLGVVLGLPEDQRKRVSDKQLIQVFCVPEAIDNYGHAYWTTPQCRPEQWAQFKEYAKYDAIALREIHKRLPTHNYQGENLRSWHLNYLRNERGFQFDRELATAAVDLLQKAKALNDQKAASGTEGAVTAATQRDKLLEWLNRHIDIPNLRAAEIRDWLEHDDLSPEVRFMLALRLEAAKSSGSKYKRGLEVVAPDGRVRCAQQFNGAGRTGRESGKGFQPHNMARPVTTVPDPARPNGLKTVPVKAQWVHAVLIPGIRSGAALDNEFIYGGPNEACANSLRGAIVAALGNELVVVDWSNIESRILAWIADEAWKLVMYRDIDAGKAVDAYKLLFHQFFGVQIEQIDDQQRQSGKVSELAFGFHGGVGALVTMAAQYFMDLDALAPIVLARAEPAALKRAQKAHRRAVLEHNDFGLSADAYIACDLLKQAYRKANAKIEALAYDLDRAIKAAIRAPGSSYLVGKCTIWFSGDWLVIQLPSGRRLLYCQPRINTETYRDPETGKETVRDYVTYYTARGKNWWREKAWNGLWVENIVQAIAHDILRAAERLVYEDAWTIPVVAEYLRSLPEDERTPISLEVHDEIDLDLPKGAYPLDRLIRMATTELTARTPWLRGLPLAASGWTGMKYKK